MSYCSSLETDLRLKQGLKMKFLRELEFRKKQCRSDTWDILLFEELRLEGRNITYTDPYSKWEGDQDFAGFLAPFVEAGNLRFVRDDGERWGYHFDGQGIVYALTWKEVMGKQPIIRAGFAPPMPANAVGI